MSAIDLLFRATGRTVPLDHRYALFSAISSALGATVHDATSLGICPISGVRVGNGTLQLTPRSCLRVRTAPEMVPAIIRLSGQSLDLLGDKIRLGVPHAVGLVPADTLRASLVTIKGFREPASFLEAARRQLTDPPNPDSSAPPECRGGLRLPSGIEVVIPLRRDGAHADKPTRRVFRIRGKIIVGFALVVGGLTAEESVLLQEVGIGGRRHMGCGVFGPVRARDAGR